MGWKSPWNTSILGRRFLGHLFLLHRRVANPSIHYWGDHPFPVQHWVRDGESRPYMGHNWLLDDDLPYNLWQKGWNRSCFHLLNSWTNKTSAFFEFFEARQRSTEDEDLKKSLKITILFGFIWHQVYFVIVLDGHRGDFFPKNFPNCQKVKAPQISGDISTQLMGTISSIKENTHTQTQTASKTCAMRIF